MFKSYFFIPANKKKFLEKIKNLKGIDHRVFDLEDSLLAKEVNKSIEFLSKLDLNDSDWLRIPLMEGQIKQIILDSMEIGISNYVIPKFKGLSEIRILVNEIISFNPKAKFILLIENAKSYVELEVILKEFNKFIHGVSLGIHDFTYDAGLKNDYMFMQEIRIKVMLLCKAYSVEPIDVVSRHLKSKEKLISEIINGFSAGYRAKFLIHPFQLDTLKSVPYYTKKEINEYREILKYYINNIEGKEALFTYNGSIYEKMHMKEIERIVKWGNEFYGTVG